MSRLMCGPYTDWTETRRHEGEAVCNEKCKFWEQCVRDVGCFRIPNEFKERDLTPLEEKHNLGHITYNGKIKIWDLFKKKKI